MSSHTVIVILCVVQVVLAVAYAGAVWNNHRLTMALLRARRRIAELEADGPPPEFTPQ